MKVHTCSLKMVVIALCFTIGSTTGCRTSGSSPHETTVIIEEVPVGMITLGTGWNTWDHWWGRHHSRFRLDWNDQQWAAYLKLLKESGADWVRLDFYYGNTEPRNDNDDPETINWAAFTFDSPRLTSLYKHLDFFQANGIDVYLTYTYLRSNHEYNLDRQTGWLSKEAVSKGFPELWTRPKDEPVDKRELAENLAATTYYLIKKRGYTCIKQIALYVEPDSQWVNVDGFQDTLFLGKLLAKLGIRDQVDILAPHVNIFHQGSWPPQKGDYDIYATEDYDAVVDWKSPQEGLKYLHPLYETMVSDVKSRNPSMEVALMEYGKYWNRGATSPLPSYLSTLSTSCLVFALYNSGFAGTQRWSFEPIYHPYSGFGVIKVEGVSFAPAATKVTPSGITPILTAMEHGAKVVKVPQTFEPQRLVNTNLRRGSTVYQVEVADPTPPGKGICAVAVKNKVGQWHIGLINLSTKARQVDVVFVDGESPGTFRWDYYDAPLRKTERIRSWLTSRMPDVEPFRFVFRAARASLRKVEEMLGATDLPEHSLEGARIDVVNDTLSLRLTPRSINFLTDPPQATDGDSEERKYQ